LKNDAPAGFGVHFQEGLKINLVAVDFRGIFVEVLLEKLI
jgi:hypothetical protein